VMLHPGDATLAHSGVGRGRSSIEFPEMTKTKVTQ
jgi:hypothetical protein